MPYSRASAITPRNWSLRSRPIGTQSPTAEWRAVALRGDADVVVAVEVGCVGRAAGAAAAPTRRSSSARNASGPTRSSRNLKRALPRALRFSSASRKIAVTCSTTSGASSGVTKTSTQRAKRGTADSPPPTRRLKPRVPSSAIAPESATSLMSPRAQSSAQPVTLILYLRGRLEKARLPRKCRCSAMAVA